MVILCFGVKIWRSKEQTLAESLIKKISFGELGWVLVKTLLLLWNFLEFPKQEKWENVTFRIVLLFCLFFDLYKWVLSKICIWEYGCKRFSIKKKQKIQLQNIPDGYWDSKAWKKKRKERKYYIEVFWERKDFLRPRYISNKIYWERQNLLKNGNLHV